MGFAFDAPLALLLLVPALALTIALYLSAIHLVFFWPNFPWWYNLGVALLAAPAVLLGGKLAGRFVRPSVRAAVT